MTYNPPARHNSATKIHDRPRASAPQFLLVAYFFSLALSAMAWVALPPVRRPVRRAAMRPTLRPCALSRRTVAGLPVCWWLPPPKGCSTGFIHTPRTTGHSFLLNSINILVAQSRDSHVSVGIQRPNFRVRFQVVPIRASPDGFVQQLIECFSLRALRIVILKIQPRARAHRLLRVRILRGKPIALRFHRIV